MLVGRVPFAGPSPTAIMLKHLQEPPPSVLDERKDLPHGVDIVISKALAKHAEDRYQSAGELVEDLVIAAGAGLLERPSNERATNRIVVPTAPPEAPVDEQTLVSARIPAAPPAAVREQVVPLSGFNPWRIIIPSAAGLLVVFGVIYAFTRTSTPLENSNQQGTSTLVADPNGQPVQPGASPTGRDEQGIPVGGTVNLNTNVNANATVSPTPLDSINANTINANMNDNRTANVNAELPSPRATPEASPKPTNAPLPSPRPAATEKPAESPPPR